jgi:dihydroorotase
VSGSPKFFLGTDTAPHPVADKERDCGCAGIFSAPAAIETYAGVFDEEGALDRLEAFASLNGPRFYGLPANDARLTLERRPWTMPHEIATPVGPLRPFLAGETMPWSVVAGFAAVGTNG